MDDFPVRLVELLDGDVARHVTGTITVDDIQRVLDDLHRNRTVIACAPEHQPLVREAIERTGMPGLFEVVATAVVDGDHVYVVPNIGRFDEIRFDLRPCDWGLTEENE